MQIDDRLATVLRNRAAGEAAARTQFRQLLDLLGTARDIGDPGLAEAAQARLAELGRIIPADEQSRILREPGLRLRNPALLETLAGGDARPAAAAMATARLTEAEWEDLIPRLPITARGFLRHRRDLPEGARETLRRLGVMDLVLPDPGRSEAPPLAVTPAPTEPEPESEEGIRVLLRRIEAFREGRQNRVETTPQGPSASEPRLLETVDFDIAASGRIDAADAEVAPHLVGVALGNDDGAIARLATADLIALRQHLPLREVPFHLDRPAPLGGEWRLDAVPLFSREGGHYTGHVCRIRRPFFDEAAPSPDDAGERIRQLLHELRTPVNAIQGFAEIIQQQLFAPVPNEYRALAAGIAVDAARLLAGFDEVDRLAKLESGAMQLEPGQADMREALGQTIRRLEGATRQRSAGFDLAASGSPFTVALDPSEALVLVWRIMASVAGALAPGEKVAVDVSGDGATVSAAFQLPQGLVDKDDLFAASAPDREAALRAGTFGTGFAMRLARAEARAAGGSLTVNGQRLTLELPCLTMNGVAPSWREPEGPASA